MTREMISLREAAERTGMSPDFWRERVANGDIPGIRYGLSIRVDWGDVQAYGEPVRPVFGGFTDGRRPPRTFLVVGDD